jgi:hypothetical protein
MNFPEQEKNNWLEKMHENITFWDDFIALLESRYTAILLWFYKSYNFELQQNHGNHNTTVILSNSLWIQTCTFNLLLWDCNIGNCESLTSIKNSDHQENEVDMFNYQLVFVDRYKLATTKKKFNHFFHKIQVSTHF